MSYSPLDINCSFPVLPCCLASSRCYLCLSLMAITRGHCCILNQINFLQKTWTILKAPWYSPVFQTNRFFWQAKRTPNLRFESVNKNLIFKIYCWMQEPFASMSPICFYKKICFDHRHCRQTDIYLLWKNAKQFCCNSKWSTKSVFWNGGWFHGLDSECVSEMFGVVSLQNFKSYGEINFLISCLESLLDLDRNQTLWRISEVIQCDQTDLLFHFGVNQILTGLCG